MTPLPETFVLYLIDCQGKPFADGTTYDRLDEVAAEIALPFCKAVGADGSRYSLPVAGVVSTTRGDVTAAAKALAIRMADVSDRLKDLRLTYDPGMTFAENLAWCEDAEADYAAGAGDRAAANAGRVRYYEERYGVAP